ncbi:MAG: hypothetical protein A3G93_16440 [Nitrospinae bacterium RIFCSPLOWO2_12_FULL_45_22]|nr:MAG: hypothetical protein A3G93_16440 [Nitrospinae bacterium RIFCSPLOWO2_12_FULL_45_22]
MLGVVSIPVKKNIVRAQELRVALTKASGLELCRAVVREGLLGRSVVDMPTSLRDRLVAVKKSFVQRNRNESLLRTCTDVVFVPGTDCALDYVLSAGNFIVMLGRHLHGEIGTSTSRRAMLPAAALTELINAASVVGEPVIQAPATSEQPKHIVYAPELVWRPLRGTQVSSTKANDPGMVQRELSIRQQKLC